LEKNKAASTFPSQNPATVRLSIFLKNTGLKERYSCKAFFYAVLLLPIGKSWDTLEDAIQTSEPAFHLEPEQPIVQKREQIVF